MTPVQGTDANRECEVEGWLARLQLEVLGGNLPQAHSTSRHDIAGSCGRLLDRPSGSINPEDVPIPDAPGHLASRRTGTAADLEDAHPGPQGKRVDDLGEPGREVGHAY